MCARSFDLVNTYWYLEHEHIEKLDNLQWLNVYILPPNERLDTISEEAVTALKALRDLSRDLFDGRLSTEAVVTLNYYLAQTPFYPQLLEGKEVVFLPEGDGETKLLSAIAIELAELLASERIKLVKRCQNEACGFYFLDSSKNQSRKFCSKKCNNLIKTRNFRARHKG
jgi:predicted RNA-binding Zn ribbon-like protein